MVVWRGENTETKRLGCLMYKYECNAGTYESDTLIGLLWERFKHKLWHLRKHGKWMD